MTLNSCNRVWIYRSQTIYAFILLEINPFYYPPHDNRRISFFIGFNQPDYAWCPSLFIKRYKWNTEMICKILWKQEQDIEVRIRKGFLNFLHIVKTLTIFRNWRLLSINDKSRNWRIKSCFGDFKIGDWTRAWLSLNNLWFYNKTK